jgi:hypothetical protein
MQQDAVLLDHGGQKLCSDMQVVGGPDFGKADTFVSLKIGPDRREKNVRVKLTDHERRNLRVAVFRSEFGRGF